MKKILLLLTCVHCISQPATAQKAESLPNNLQLNIGRSFHGSGDLRGVFFSAEYGHYFKKRLEVSGTISSGIYPGAYTLLISGPSGNYDASFRYVTAGMQTGGKIGFALIRSASHEFKIQGGAFVRYQASSSEGYGVAFPPSINYPEPVFTFRNSEKQKIFTIGYSADIGYSFTTQKNLLLGIKAGFQNDSNADVLTHLLLTIGKRLKGKK